MQKSRSFSVRTNGSLLCMLKMGVIEDEILKAEVFRFPIQLHRNPFSTTFLLLIVARRLTIFQTRHFSGLCVYCGIGVPALSAIRDYVEI